MIGLRLDVVADADEFADLRGEWGDAVASDPDANVFLTWQWAYTWWQHFGAGSESGGGRRLHVVVVRDGRGVVAVLPLYRSRAGIGPLAVTVLRPVGQEGGDYGGAVLARHEPQAVELLVNHLGAQLRSGVGVVVLSRLARDARFTALVGEELVRHAATVETVVDQLDEVHLTVEVWRGFDLAPQAVAGDVAVVSHTGATLEAGLDRLVALAGDADTEPPAPLADPAGTAFLLDAVRALDGEGAVGLASLEVDGQAVAVQLDLVVGRRVQLYAGTSEVLHHHTLAEGLARGMTVFDFGRAEDPDVRRWANGARRMTTVTLSRPGLPGALARQRARLRASGRRRRRSGRPA